MMFLGNGSFLFHDVYKITEQSPDVEISRYAKWDKSLGIKIEKKSFWDRRSNLHGHNLRYCVRYQVLHNGAVENSVEYFDFSFKYIIYFLGFRHFNGSLIKLM